jgi:hypothetical protein
MLVLAEEIICFHKVKTAGTTIKDVIAVRQEKKPTLPINGNDWV